MTQHPRRQTGYKVLGYRVARNGHAFLDDNIFRSIQAAQQATEAACDYPLEWRPELGVDGLSGLRVGITDPAELDCTRGGHPRALEQGDDRAKHWFSRRRDREDPDPNIEAEIGHAAYWDRYYIEQVQRPIYETIKDAEVVTGDYYVQCNGSGWWDVRCNHHWVDSFPTRVEAIASIWDRFAEFERQSRAPRRRSVSKIAALMKLAGVAFVIMSIFALGDMWLDGSLAREGWRRVWTVPVLAIASVLLLGAYFGAFAWLISLQQGVIRNIIVGVIAASLLTFLVLVTLDQYRAGDWQFTICGGIVLLGVVGAIWERGKLLQYARGKRTP